MQINRNDPCYCGSGKKFKKCCISKESQKDVFDSFNQNLYNAFNNPSISSQKFDSKAFFKEFNTAELLKTFAMLQVLPENHGKYLRIEDIQKQIILSDKGSKKPVDFVRLESFVSKNHARYLMEDPPENLFTQNIKTPVGNMLIFSGITEGQPFVLEQFLNVLVGDSPLLSDSFKTEALDSCLLLLMISNQIANHFKYERNLFVESTGNNLIHFPKNQDSIDYLKNSFSYSHTQIERIAKYLSCSPDLINDYVVDLKHEGFKSNDDNFNPIIYSPIVKLEDEYIIASPTNIVFACVNNVLKRAIHSDCLNTFLDYYSRNCWSYCCFAFRKMGYQRIGFDMPGNNISIPILEDVFIFDSQKIAYVSMLYDNGDSYNVAQPFSTYFGEGMEQGVTHRKSQVFNALKADIKFDKFDFFDINIVCGIGRPIGFAYERTSPKIERISFSINDLIVLEKSRKCHNLTLWNYVKALKKVNLTNPYFLDRITYFIENDESFYTSDEKIDYLILPVGNALSFKSKAFINSDEHLAIYSFKNLSQLLPVAREKLPGQLPIYSTKYYSPLFPFMVFTPCLGKGIWVKPIKDCNNPVTEKEFFDTELCIAIGYWFNEISSLIRGLADFESLNGIIIEIETTKLKELPDNISQTLDDEIIIESDQNKLIVKLNEHFYTYLFRSDNLAERILVKKLLQKVNEILGLRYIDSSLDDAKIEHILDTVIPIGLKKKIFLVVSDEEDIRIENIESMPLRKLSKYEVNSQIDDLGILLSPAPYAPKDIITLKEKTELVNLAVAHFKNELQQIADNCNNQHLLSVLITMYEASIQNREKFRLEANPMIECFGHHCNILEIVSKKNKKRVELSVSLRCLIEHIIAEPARGKESISVEDYDRLVAYMVNMINWGFISDSLRFNVADIDISLLPSGRIGTGKQFQEEVIYTYYDQKLNEDLFDYKNNVLEKLGDIPLKNEKPKTSKIDKQFKDAFEAEFEITYDNFLLIINESINSRNDWEEGYYKDTKHNFINQISEKCGLSTEIIDKFLMAFSLHNRGTVDNVTEFGFKNQDYFPWRFNRELSLLRRPILIVLLNEEEYVLFGFRTLLDFLSNLNSKILSGRFNAKSSLMNSFLRKVNDNNGKDFNIDVYNFLKRELNDSLVLKEIQINQKSKLLSTEDLGDLDILVIDFNKRKIIAIECKCINSSKTPYEMYLDFQKFIGGSKPWIPKVDKRDNWMKNNIEQISKLDKNLNNLSGFTFESIFLTNEAVPLPLVKDYNINYRFVTFYDVQRNKNIIFG